MIGFFVLGTITGVIILCVVSIFIHEGIKDNLSYPFGCCDTSMVEECLPEGEKQQW
jgi:hypothetical protein